MPHSFLGNETEPTKMLKELYKENFLHTLFPKEGIAEEEFERYGNSLRTIFKF